MRALRFLAVVPLALIFSCAGQEFTAVESGGAGGSATAGAGGVMGSGGSSVGGSHAGNGGTGGADAGRTKNSGDCDTASDCGGDPCIDISSGGYRACVAKVPEAIVCSSPPGECCKTVDCAAAGKPGKCLLGPT